MMGSPPSAAQSCDGADWRFGSWWAAVVVMVATFRFDRLKDIFQHQEVQTAHVLQEVRLRGAVVAWVL